MSSSRSSGRPVRRSVTAAAVLALVAPLLALVGLVTSPAVAADNITFRAGASGRRRTRSPHRVTIPAAVRETDGLLLFVTSNKALASVVATPAGWTLGGHATVEHRHRDDPLQQGRGGQRRRAQPGGRLHGDHQGDPDAARLRRHRRQRRRPDRDFASAAETTNRATHTTPGANVATAGSYVVSYWADKSSATTGWTLPGRPDPAQHRARHRRRADHLGGVRPERTRRRSAPRPARTATADASTGKATMWTVVLRPDPDANPNVAPVASFTVELPARDLHGRRLGLHRHRARHRRVVRLGLRRRRHRHRRDHDAHLHDQRQQDDHADRHRQPGPDRHRPPARST